MWPFIRGERPRNRLLGRKSSCSPLFSTLFSNPLPRPSILPCAEREWTCWKRHPGKLEMCRWCDHCSAKKKEGRRKWQGDDPSRYRRRRGSEELGRREDATASDDERTRKGTERRNAVYALSVIGKGERPSMWRTCRCCRRCCSLPIEGAGRCRSQSRHGRDSRHAKSPMTDAAVCERGFRAMEIGESLAESAHLGFSSDFSRERPETWPPRLYPEASPAVSTHVEGIDGLSSRNTSLALLLESDFYSGKWRGRDFEIYFLLIFLLYLSLRFRVKTFLGCPASSPPDAPRSVIALLANQTRFNCNNWCWKWQL